MSALSTYLRWAKSYGINVEATIQATTLKHSGLTEMTGHIESVGTDDFNYKVNVIPAKETGYGPQEFYTSDLNALIEERPEAFKVSGFTPEVQEKIKEASLYGYSEKGTNHNIFFNGTPEYDAFEEASKSAQENEKYLQKEKKNSYEP